MEALRNGIELTGTLFTSALGDAKDKLAYAEQIWDNDKQEYQSLINETITTIKDENGSKISEMVVDNSEEDDSIEVYTKQQCDARFVKIWTGTLEEYDAIPVKDNGYLYIVTA